MNIGEILGHLLSAGGQGFSTYGALKQAEEEKKHQRVREGIEDERYREGVNFKYREETARESDREYGRKRDRQTDIMGQAKQAGIVGLTPDVLDGARDGNQVQTGTGAGVGGNALQSALRSLQIAQQQPGFDPRKQTDLGNGMAFQGPQFGTEPTPHFSPVQGEDQIGAFDNRTGNVRGTGFVGRAPVTGSAMDPRGKQVIQLDDGTLVVGDKFTHTTTPMTGPHGESQVKGTHATPSNEERSAASAVSEMASAMGDVKAAYEKSGYRAPSLMSQEAMRHGGVAGNALVSAMDPSYQNLYNKQQLVLNNLLYLKSGKVITDNEFKRLRGFLEIGANDRPETIKSKLATMDQELAALTIRAGRAQNQMTTAGNGDDAKADEWDALVAGGVGPEEATRRINAKYQGR